MDASLLKRIVENHAFTTVVKWDTSKTLEGIPMVEVNEVLTRHVAHLARLELSTEEVKLFTLQLNEIIEYFEKLQEVDVRNTEPMIHPFLSQTPLREDQARSAPLNAEGQPKTLDSAPELQNDGYKVPPIL